MAREINQVFHIDCQTGINEQINKELHTSYCFQAMSFYFNRDDAVLFSLGRLFYDQSLKELQNAEKLMEYQNKRGGRIILKDVVKPKKNHWTAESALVTALEFEKLLNESFIDLFYVAKNCKDSQLMNFVSKEFLVENIESTKPYGNRLTNIQRNGFEMGLYFYDNQELKDN